MARLLILLLVLAGGPPPAYTCARQTLRGDVESWVPLASCPSPLRLCYEGPTALLERAAAIDPANPCRKHARISTKTCAQEGFARYLFQDPVFTSLGLWIRD